MRRAILYSLPILLIGLSTLPWYAGQRAQGQYADLLHGLERRGVRVVENRYRQGWLTSEAVAVLAYDSPPVRADWPQLRLRSHIRHGPLGLKALAKGRLEFLSAHADTYLDLLGADQAPRPQSTRLSMRVGLHGDTRLHFLPTPVQGVLPDLRGELQLDAALERIHGSLTLGPFDYTDVTGLQLSQGVLDMALDSTLGAAGLRLGSSHLELAGLSVQSPDWPSALRIDGLSLETELGAEQGTVWATADYRIKRIGFDGDRFENAQLRLRLDGLSAAVLGRLSGSLDGLAAEHADAGRKAFALFGLVMGNLHRLLQGGPHLRLERLHLDTPEGPLDATLELGFSGMVANQVLDARRWLESLSASGRLELPEALLQQLLRVRVRNELLQLYAIRKELDVDFQIPESTWQTMQATRRARDQIDTLLRQEFAVREAGQLRTRFRLSAGLLSINGKTVPLPP